MAHLILIIIGTLAFGGVCFWMGRRSRKYPLQGLTETQALYYFILKEEHRHLADIRRGRKERRRLRKDFPGIEVAEGRDLEAWIEAKKGTA